VTDRERSDSGWCHRPPALAAEAIDAWAAMLRASHPWNEMFLDDLTGEFPAVLEALLRSTDGADWDVRATRLRALAREHGAFRRRQSCSALVLTEEVALAEEAIAAALIRTGAGPETMMSIQDSLAPVMEGIERAMYSGYVD
jgi:hypothetical protein